MKRLLRTSALAAVCLALASCQPAPRDIVVKWRNGQLVVDFPRSIWRLLGLQDRTYCIQRVELFDPQKMLWVLSLPKDRWESCTDVKMPFAIGKPLTGFESEGRPHLRSGVTYGVLIEGIGEGRVDFRLRGREAPINETDWEKQISAPCGSWDRSCAGTDGLTPN